MKLKLGDRDKNGSRRFTLSDWDGAVEEPLSGDVPVPQLTQPVRNNTAVRRGSDDSADNSNKPSSADSTAPSVSSDNHSTTTTRRRRSSIRSVKKGSILRRFSAVSSQDGTVETDPDLGSDRGSDFFSSSGSNIWSKILGQNESLWDGANGKGAFEEEDDTDYGEDGNSNFDCRKSMKRCRLTWWWETQHFFSTMVKYPHILLLSLLTFGVLCGVGIAAITAEKENYIEKQKATAEFVVSMPNRAISLTCVESHLLMHIFYFYFAYYRLGRRQIGLVMNFVVLCFLFTLFNKEFFIQATLTRYPRRLVGIPTFSFRKQKRLPLRCAM